MPAPPRPPARIRAVASAVPPHALQQGEIQQFTETLFAGFENLARYLPVFTNTQIEQRHLAQPLAWYGEPHSFPETNALYEQSALTLALEASRRALAQADVPPEQVGMVVLVSTTGIATPSLDAQLIGALGLSPHTARLPVWGLGCAGGVAGLAHAATLAAGIPGRVVLLVAVELCSLTFQHNDRSKSNLIAASLFADGAAAVVLGTEGDGPQVLGQQSTLFENSAAVMGWDVVASGLKVRFARSIPAIIANNLPGLLAEACAAWGIAPATIRHYVLHPGGAKVLAAYADSLGLSESQLHEAREVLRCYGNMSSASVLFVLEQMLAAHPPGGADHAVMMALGPGFSAEQVLLRW